MMQAAHWETVKAGMRNGMEYGMEHRIDKENGCLTIRGTFVHT